MRYLPYAVSAWLFLAGLYGIAASRNMIHLVVCLGVLQSSTYILILAAGYRTGGIAPVFADWPPGTPAVDPVVHALVLTDIVVGATVTALLLVFAIQIYNRRGTMDPDQIQPLRK